MIATMLVRAILLVSCSVWLSACASQPSAESGGWAGRGASFHYSTSGLSWGFDVVGDDLVLTRNDTELRLIGCVPVDGVRYVIHSEALPEIEFALTGDRRARWRGDALEVGDAAHTFGSVASVELRPR